MIKVRAVSWIDADGIALVELYKGMTSEKKREHWLSQISRTSDVPLEKTETPDIELKSDIAVQGQVW
ncbi:MAG: hypothetical protein F6K19_01610 [Cyanothece sp. SIO1E1]|nr:hypothetical protein [Cyanothece sp. SIO1E1]